MKIKRLDAHDRLIDFTKKNSNDINECCQNLINQRPFGDEPFYIYAHTRTDEDGVTKRLIWQPRLTRPLPSTNSMLFKAYPGTDHIKICWILPDRAMWPQYEKGKLTESSIVCWSCDMFDNDRKALEVKEPDDLNDEQIDKVYQSLARAAKAKKSGLII